MKNRKTYIALASPEDRGPIEHINAVLAYQKKEFNFITNLPENVLLINAHCHTVELKNTNYFRKQLEITKILRKISCRGSSNVLIRHSVGLILPHLYLMLINKRPILELNGFTPQDLKDRNKAIHLRIINFLLDFFILHFSKNLVVVHENLKKLYSKRYFLPLSKFSIIHNGINEVELENLSEDINSKPYYKLGYLGSLAPREGVDLLISYFKKLPQDEFQLIIIGGENAEFEKLNKNKNLNILHYSNMDRPNALSLLNKVDICIHLRRPLKGKFNSQGMPLKMLDYLYLNKPVIASKVQSYDFLVELDFGTLIDPYSFEEFYNSVMKLKTMKVIQGQQRLRFIQENFLWKNKIEELNQIWN